MTASAAARFRSMNPGGSNPADRLRVERGSIADYDALSRHHYRAGRPATWDAVLRMVDPGAGLVAVLVASRPTLNGRWRELAWPGRYRGVGAASRLNRELRTISRVVVDPRWRGVGVAGRLVRAYLERPRTPATEAVAVMGAVCPFFARAGMTEYRLAPTPADARLLDALAHERVEAWELLDAGSARRVVKRSALLRRELRAWADTTKRFRRIPPRNAAEQARRAGAWLTEPPVAYAWSA